MVAGQLVSLHQMADHRIVAVLVDKFFVSIEYHIDNKINFNPHLGLNRFIVSIESSNGQKHFFVKEGRTMNNGDHLRQDLNRPSKPIFIELFHLDNLDEFVKFALCVFVDVFAFKLSHQVDVHLSALLQKRKCRLIVILLQNL